MNIITSVFLLLISIPKCLLLISSSYKSDCKSSSVCAKSTVSSAYRKFMMLCPPIDAHFKSSRERIIVSLYNEKRSGEITDTCRTPRFNRTISQSLELTRIAAYC